MGVFKKSFNWQRFHLILIWTQNWKISFYEWFFAPQSLYYFDMYHDLRFLWLSRGYCVTPASKNRKNQKVIKVEVLQDDKTRVVPNFMLKLILNEIVSMSVIRSYKSLEIVFKVSTAKILNWLLYTYYGYEYAIYHTPGIRVRHGIIIIYSPLKSSFCLHDFTVGHHLDHCQRAYSAPVVDRFASVPSGVRVRGIRDGQRAFTPVSAHDRVFSGRQWFAILEPRHPRLRDPSDLCTRDTHVIDSYTTLHNHLTSLIFKICTTSVFALPLLTILGVGVIWFHKSSYVKPDIN